MRLALLGMGRMGHAVDRVVCEAGHEVALRLDETTNAGARGLSADALTGIDVAIDFTVPEAVIDNLEALSRCRVPVVIGTTGWYEHLESARRIVERSGNGCIVGANFSIGAHLFMQIAEFVSGLMNRFPEYDPYVVEHHHRGKMDAPSGTALRLGELVVDKIDRKNHIARGGAEGATGADALQVVSIRAGDAYGTHQVGFDSPGDTITLEHVARNREGFARGAVRAAEWIPGRRGLYDFSAIFEGES